MAEPRRAESSLCVCAYHNSLVIVDGIIIHVVFNVCSNYALREHIIDHAKHHVHISGKTSSVKYNYLFVCIKR